MIPEEGFKTRVLAKITVSILFQYVTKFVPDKPIIILKIR